MSFTSTKRFTFLKSIPTSVRKEIKKQLKNEPGEWRILTDRAATIIARNNIKRDLWAFKASFVVDHMRGNLGNARDGAIEALKVAQEKLCEDATPLVRAMIRNLKEFVDDAIDADGRGHFMNTYDGEEHEMTVGKETFYAYRTN